MNPLMNPVGSKAEGKLNCINAVVITHQCTVILIELPCIFFLPKSLVFQWFPVTAGITEPVLESFPGRAFSVYSVSDFSPRCNFERRYGRAIVPVVTL